MKSNSVRANLTVAVVLSCQGNFKFSISNNSIISNCTNPEMAYIHFLYSLATGNGKEAQRIYYDRYHNILTLCGKTCKKVTCKIMWSCGFDRQASSARAQPVATLDREQYRNNHIIVWSQLKNHIKNLKTETIYSYIRYSWFELYSFGFFTKDQCLEGGWSIRQQNRIVEKVIFSNKFCWAFGWNLLGIT